MAAITVTYARLWNLGNYENERLEVVVTVSTDVEAAFAEAVQAVNDQHALMQAEKDAAEQRRRDEWEEKQRASREAAITSLKDKPVAEIPF